MVISGKIYKDCNTHGKLADLNDVKLIALGVDQKEERKLILKATREFRKRGDDYASETSTLVGGSAPTALLSEGKRKRDHRDASFDEVTPTSFNFGEVMDEQVLEVKSVIINRAPIMMCWATIVAERMGFQREEALSIGQKECSFSRDIPHFTPASVFTEMNAVAKGVTLNRIKPDEGRLREAVKGGSQSYVEFIGRRIPLYQTQAGQWRALSSGNPVEPHTAFSYISRALRQTLPYVTGALRLLADTFNAQDLNHHAWTLYAEFRPRVNEWGKRSEMKCSDILRLRQKSSIKIPDCRRCEVISEDVTFKRIRVGDDINSDGSLDREFSHRRVNQT